MHLHICIQVFFSVVLFIGILISAARPASTAATTPQAPGPAFGVASHFMWHDLSRARVDLNRIQAADITTVRFDVNWEDFEPQQGQWNIDYLTRLDAVLAEMKSREMQPILVILETPPWARSFTGSNMTPPDQPDDFGAALGYLAQRYADFPGLAYEIWNEPNDPHFWNTPTGPNAAFYTRMLKAAYTQIKAVAPDATVLGGSILFNDRRYLDKMYAAGVRWYFDALALHPYNKGMAPHQTKDEQTSFPLAVSQMKERMAAHGDADKPIWITEMGWPTSKVDDATRATYYAQAVEMMRAWPYVKVFCAYTLNQVDDPTYGLVTSDGTSTASWKAYIATIRHFSKPPRPSAQRRRFFRIEEQPTFYCLPAPERASARSRKPAMALACT